MPWPTDDLSTSGVDSGADRPPRAEFFKLFQRVKTIIAGRGSADGVASLDGRRRVPDAELGRGIAGGVAALDGAGRVPSAQLPPQPTPPQAVPTGTILAFAGARPTGWLSCRGAAVSRATYPALFAVIGTRLRPGRRLDHLQPARSQGPLRATAPPVDAAGPATTGGAETHTLTEAEMPTHGTHSRRRAPGRRGRGSKQAHRHNRHCVHGGRRRAPTACATPAADSPITTCRPISRSTTSLRSREAGAATGPPRGPLRRPCKAATGALQGRCTGRPGGRDARPFRGRNGLDSGLHFQGHLEVNHNL